MPDEAVWNSHQSGTQILGQYQVPHVGTVVPLFTKGHFYEHGLEKSVFEIKGAGSFHDIRQTMKDLSANNTSRYPKVVKIAPNHRCQ